jgi:hypothetical protein
MGFVNQRERRQPAADGCVAASIAATMAASLPAAPTGTRPDGRALGNTARRIGKAGNRADRHCETESRALARQHFRVAVEDEVAQGACRCRSRQLSQAQYRDRSRPDRPSTPRSQSGRSGLPAGLRSLGMGS